MSQSLASDMCGIDPGESLRPFSFQGEPFHWMFPRVETWLKPRAESRQPLRGKKPVKVGILVKFIRVASKDSRKYVFILAEVKA
jgi:hypothetical protein